MHAADRRNSKRVRFPSGIFKNESCRHPLHKPESPLVESSIIIKLQRTFSSSLIFSLYSFSCLSRLSLTSTVKSSSNFPPAQAPISSHSSCASGRICLDASSTMGVNHCSEELVISSAPPIFTPRSCCFPETFIVSFIFFMTQMESGLKCTLMPLATEQQRSTQALLSLNSKVVICATVRA